MFTLVYINNQFNRPDSLANFLESSIGGKTLLRIDCINPYHGTERDFICDVCNYMCGVNPMINVTYAATQNISTESQGENSIVNYMVTEIAVSQKK